MGDHPFNSRADAGPGVIKITKAGWLYIILTIFLGFSAVNTANNLMYLVVSALLGFMAISGLFGKRNLSKIDIDMELPEEIYANTGIPVRITLINNRRFLPAFLLKVRLLNDEVLFPFVDARAAEPKYMNIFFPERGRSRIGDIHLCSVFPFNFFVRCKKLDKVFESVVFPQAKKCELPGLFEKAGRARGEKSTDKAGYEAEMISLRDYIKGDPLKYIHWKASAKTGRLKTKELSSLSRQPVIIDFDTLTIKNVEEKISCVTYLLLKLFRKNVPVRLKIGGSFYKTGLSKTAMERTQADKISMLRKLALYDKE